MTMKRIYTTTGACAAAVAIAYHALPAHAEEIRVVDNAPYTIDPIRHPDPDSGHNGFFLDIVRQMATAMKRDIPVKFVGWQDAQAESRAGHDILFFPYSRTAEHEPNYMWVQKVWDIEEVFVSRPGAAAIDSYDAGNALRAIGVVGGSTGHAELKKRGFSNLKLYSNAAAVTEAVAAREVDAAYSADIELKYAWRAAKHPGNLVVGKTLARRVLYIAASKDSPGIDRDAWAKAFDTVKRDGVVDRAYAYYFGQK
ncbi:MULTISPECIES: ABC transporter substrate-binding protein [Paraburkholderia]|uniref:Transporter substrate-binding domain-containing protein n=1 Tax=Paraburkholderia madseniana TaxID=2599607 RepID=A0AAP5BPU1_9BURK|nr:MULTISPECIES: transporter substrate-binding domain-containing protein [Paraburkholderia]MCX4151953.1 transporter substrate-binding domain-containing protein [Paraburkholderia madseniana]MDN7154881.1 transporter substrate-binding domain-containing protein [Paraburkholderia sp. WS6]MDQ6413764.1 transporter substrate-binding domain-containing protein [Paraburkholderia madseniana]